MVVGITASACNV